ncbi:MAG: bifunctional enoyl-CoA hydratase/phosphate acetyltransferase [Alphaproteobacteria bacterium]|jgi:phosphotransacetylase|nr:bifunctional enoyl-CoA hydratase/phosphate acetyltransferase [Alphaproteobacteria bacterium]
MAVNFQELLQKAKQKGKIKVAVVNPVDEVSLGGPLDAMKKGLITPVLFGSKKEIEATAKKYSFDISGCEIVDCESEATTIQAAVDAAREGRVQSLMKGKVHTDHLMGAVVKRETGLRTDSQISSVFVFSVPTYHKLLFITDPAINITPSLEQKEKIILNAVKLINNIGIAKPKVGGLSAVENVNPKILGSVEAAELANNPNLKEKCIIEGPFAFDNIISKKAAEIKGIKSDVSGDVDLILVPNLEVGNVLFKSLVYMANAEVAGIVLGAKVPIIITSRADDAKARTMSAALACLSI